MWKKIIIALVLLVTLAMVAGMAASPTAPALLKTYGSIPKGVVLEGGGETIAKITSVKYDPQANKFLLNGKYTYRNPVSAKEFAIILEALSKDDRLGISYTTSKDFIAYGELSDHSVVAKKLLKADLFLGGVVYGIERQIGDQELPDKYEPVVVGRERIRTAACFSFTDFTFSLDPKTQEYRADNYNFLVTIVPLSKKYADDGGNLPDMNLVKNGTLGRDYGTECQPNLRHLLGNREQYLSIPVAAVAVQYGEAAAFARRLRDSGADVGELLKVIR